MVNLIYNGSEFWGGGLKITDRDCEDFFIILIVKEYDSKVFFLSPVSQPSREVANLTKKKYM